MSINLGGLSDLNTQLAEAERLYFNLPAFMKQYIGARTPAMTDGSNRDREVESRADAGTRGGRMFQEGRINAIRQQRSALNAGTPAQIPYEAFDSKNLSNTNNVMEDPNNIFRALGEDAPNPNYFANNVGELRAEMRLVNGRMVYGLWDSNGVNVLGRQSTQTAVNTQQQAQIDQALHSESAAAQTMPDWLMGQYRAAAANAGTLGDTDQSRRGLQDDFQAGFEGATAVSNERINALRAARGLPPLQPGQTGDAGLTPPSPTDTPINWAGQPTTSGGGWVGAGTGATAPPGIHSTASTPTSTPAPAPLINPTPATTAPSTAGTATTAEKPADEAKAPVSGTPESQLADTKLTSGGAKLSNKSRLSALKVR